MDLNSICEPFLNQSPSHAEYAKAFLENANEEIVKAVQDAQVTMQQQTDAPANQIPNGQIVQHGGQQHYPQHQGYPGERRRIDSGWLS